jgi:hypothetical protein
MGRRRKRRRAARWLAPGRARVPGDRLHPYQLMSAKEKQKRARLLRVEVRLCTACMITVAARDVEAHRARCSGKPFDGGEK